MKYKWGKRRGWERKTRIDGKEEDEKREREIEGEGN